MSKLLTGFAPVSKLLSGESVVRHTDKPDIRYAHCTARALTCCRQKIWPPARALFAALKHQLAGIGISTKPPHYLIIVYPRSGPHKNSVQIAEQDVIPVLVQAGIKTTVCVTTHEGHAVERCRQLDDDVLDAWAVICVLLLRKNKPKLSYYTTAAASDDASGRY